MLLTYNITHAQLSWEALPNAISNPNGQRFDDIFFLNNNLGWAANGYYAAIYKTTDGGASWTQQLSESDLGGDYYFRNVEFLNENIGFVGTLNSTLLKTEDGGNTWNIIDNITPNPPAICGLETIGTSTIYGCGAYFTPAQIIKSTDSGNTWVTTDMSAHANALVEIKFLTETTGFVAGRNAQGATLLKTTDGGVTWTEIFNSGIQGEYLWKLQILTNNPNIMFGSISSVSPHPGKLIKSEDGGITWQMYDAPETNIQAVGFISETRGWMSGHNTRIHETNDGGQTWTDTGIGSNLNRIFILNSSLAYASGTTLYKLDETTLSNTTLDSSEKFNLNVSLKNNPVYNILELEIEFMSNDNLLIELYDANGKFIEQLTRDKIINANKKSYNFDVSHLNSGLYILNFHNNNGRVSYKILKN